MQLAEQIRVASAAFPGDPERPAGWITRRGEVLRELPGRRTYRTEIGGQPVVVKEFTPRRLRHWLRSYAETELDSALAVAARGVPVVEPLACARLRDGRQILVLREEPGARSLQQVVLEAPPTGRERHALTRRVGELMARMQNAGIRHRDPHAGNILVRPDGSVLLADAKELKAGPYLRLPERAKVLATFALFFLTHGSTVDLLVFWGAYSRAAGMLPRSLEELRRLVLARLPRAFRRLSGLRARRRRRTGRRVELGGFRGIVTGEIDPALLEEIAAQARDLRPGPHVIKQSRTAWTFLAGDPEGFVAKVFLPKKATRPLRDLLFGSRADRALEAAEALFHRGLKTPEIVAVLRDAETKGRSVLVMRKVTGARPLDQVLPGLPAARAHEAARRIGKTLRRMHDWGLRHRDLKQQNLLLSRDGAEVCFLDLDGVRQTGNLDWGRRARDLGNLASSLLDRNAVPTGLRLRGLDAYLGGETPPGFRPGGFAREVARIAREHRERRSA